MLEMLRGTRKVALLPEPFVSVLLAKKPSLRVVTSLEEAYARRFGGPARLPLAGIAVRTELAQSNPALVQSLVHAMRTAAETLSNNPEAALAALPEAVVNGMGRDVLAASLARDMILALPASEVRAEIAAFLRMVLPQTGESGQLDALPSAAFIFSSFSGSARGADQGASEGTGQQAGQGAKR